LPALLDEISDTLPTHCPARLSGIVAQTPFARVGRAAPFRMLLEAEAAPNASARPIAVRRDGPYETGGKREEAVFG